MIEKNFFEIMSEEVPGVNKAFFDLAGAIEKDGGLDAKTFQLAYIAIMATKGVSDSVRAHAGFAKKAGATREEVRGAVLLTLFTNGISGVASCLTAALEGYDSAAV